MKRTTGIPKSFLRTIEKPAILSNDGLSDGSQQPSGVMVNADGDFVIAVPDQASWEQYEAKTKQSAMANEAAESDTQELQERGLECPIDKKLFIEPTKTPCCKRTYCNDCITNALIESDLRCPGCQSEPILIDDLKPDEEVAAKVTAYLEEKVKQKDSQKKEDEKPKTPPSNAAENGDSTVKSTQQARTPSPKRKSPPKSPQISKTTKDDIVQSKKRSAEDQPEDQRVSLGSTQMKKTKSQQSNFSDKSNAHSDKPNNSSEKPNSSDKSNPSSDNSNSVSDKPNHSSNKTTSQTRGQANGTSQQKPPTGHPFPNAKPSKPQSNQLSLPTTNQFMGMPMSMGPVMGINPAMMMPPNLNGPTGNMTNLPGMGGPGFIPSPQTMYGGGYNPNFMVNGGFGSYGQNMGMPMSMPDGGMNMGMGMGTGMNMGMGMGMNASMQGNLNGMVQPMPLTGRFSNQQRTFFSEPPLDEEDNAYFRRPVNPHRHQARQRRARPSDYREL